MLEISDLINEAKKAMKSSFSPFTNNKVGVAVLTSRNKCYTGSRREIDNCSGVRYAEGQAILEAYEKKDRDIKKIVIVSSNENFAYPCGVSRQLIYEFAQDAKIVLVNSNGERQEHVISDLLPFPSKIR